MIVFKVLIAVSFLMLAACSTTHSGQKTGKLSEERDRQTIAEGEQAAQTRETEISPDVLFLLMTAEIAGQRQQYNLALDGYLRASKRVKDPEVIKRAAKIALFVQDDAKLKEVLDLWLEVEPASLDAHYLKAVTALRSGNKEDAIESLEFIIKHDGQDFDSKAVVMIKNLKTQKSMDLAYQVFAELSIQYPRNAHLYFIQALLDAQAKKMTQAQTHITHALELDPHWVKALLLQAQIYIADGKQAQATDVLKQALHEQERKQAEATHLLQRTLKGQDSAQISEQLVQLLIQQGRFEEAQDVLRELMDSHPENKELKFKAALIYLQTGEERKAREILEALVVDKQFRDKAAFYLGRIDAKAKHFDAALIWFDAIAGGPYKFDASVSAVLIRMDLKRYDIALSRLKLLRQDYPDKKMELVLLEAEIYSQKGLNQQGFDVLTSALIEAPDNQRIIYARALVAEKLGKLQVLEDDLKYILEKSPDDVNALNALGYTLVDKTARYAEAKIYLDKAIAFKPDEPVILDSYGWLLFKLERWDESLQYLQRAYDMEPQAEIAAHLTEVLWVLQNKDQARAVLMRALEKNPDDQLLLEVKTRLFGNH